MYKELTNVHTYIHACMHTYIHTHTHTYIYICIWACKPGITKIVVSPWGASNRSEDDLKVLFFRQFHPLYRSLYLLVFVYIAETHHFKSLITYKAGIFNSYMSHYQR